MSTALTSRFLSLILRHQPERIGIDLDPAGWVPVPALLAGLARNGRPTSRKHLAAVVDGDEKGRYSIDPVTDRIRANQGHTVPVDLGLDQTTPPPVLFHGTPTSAVASILASGLSRRTRHHVHLSDDVDTAHRVGARRGQHTVLTVDAARMHADGYPFYRSTNGVWLTEVVPANYLTPLGG